MTLSHTHPAFNMLTNTKKRPALCDLTNVEVDDSNDNGKCLKVGNSDSFSLMPKLKETGEHTCAHVPEVEDMNKKIRVHTQNIHPALAMYHPDGNAPSSISWTQLQHLLNPDEEESLYNFLTAQGLIAARQQCEQCGADMNRVWETGRMLWLCRRRMMGSKCNKGKKSVKTGTIFGNSNLTIQQIVSIFHHFVHRLSETQCAQYVYISS